MPCLTLSWCTVGEFIKKGGVKKREIILRKFRLFIHPIFMMKKIIQK